MNAEPEHKHVPLRYRNLISMALDDADGTIEVDHVYLPEGQAGTCCHEGCGNPAHDPGMVGITIATGDEEEGAVAGTLLTAEQALIIANRLTRAANLVLESEEDVADIEREAARYTRNPGRSGARCGVTRDFRWTQGRRRVLLALLADADRMSGYPISRTAQARSASVYAVLDHLETRRYVTAEWEERDDGKPRRRFYRLTPEGREYAMAVLELEPHADITEEI